MKEILGGDLQKTFAVLEIEAVCTYRRTNTRSEYGEMYEVWELSDIDFEKISKISDDEWNDDWGWWRSAEGSNMLGTSTADLVINGHSILAWWNEDKLDRHLEVFIDEEAGGTRDRLTEEYFSEELTFDNLLTYMCDEWGVSLERNVCALAVDLAKINNITIGELFTKYVGNK